MRCFNFTIHLIITEVRSKCLLPLIFIVKSGSKLNELAQQEIDFCSFRESTENMRKIKYNNKMQYHLTISNKGVISFFQGI